MVYNFLILFFISNFGLFYTIYSSDDRVKDSQQNVLLQESRKEVVFSDEEIWERDIQKKLDIIIKNSLNSIRKEINSYCVACAQDTLKKASNETVVWGILKKRLLAVKIEEYIDSCIYHESLGCINYDATLEFCLDFLKSKDFKDLDEDAQVELSIFIEKIRKYIDNRWIQLEDPCYLHKDNLEKLPKAYFSFEVQDFVNVSQRKKELECKHLLEDDL